MGVAGACTPHAVPPKNYFGYKGALVAMEVHMSFSDLVTKVEGLLSLKADWDTAKTALESTVSELQAKVTDLESQVAQAAANAEAAAEADVQALIAKIDAA
jgi:outer membrane murein-binding lipoprotein Lpp